MRAPTAEITRRRFRPGGFDIHRIGGSHRLRIGFPTVTARFGTRPQIWTGRCFAALQQVDRIIVDAINRHPNRQRLIQRPERVLRVPVNVGVFPCGYLSVSQQVKVEVKFCERQIRLPATKSLAASTIGRPTSISCVTLPTGSFEPVELPKRHCIADACCAIANPASPTTDRSVLRANLLKFMVYLTVFGIAGSVPDIPWPLVCRPRSPGSAVHIADRLSGPI